MDKCDNNKSLETKGQITELKPSSLLVEIEVNSACSNCSHKKSCAVQSETENRIIEVDTPDNKEYQIGDKVVITAPLKTGTMAVFIAYIVPFLLFMISLIVATAAKLSELYAGVISMSVIAFYYIVLYFLKDRIKTKISFTIKE